MIQNKARQQAETKRTERKEHLETKNNKNQKQEPETEMRNRTLMNIRPKDTRSAGTTVIFIRHKKTQTQTNKKQTQTKQTKE